MAGSGRDQYWASKYRTILKNKGKITILEVRYTSTFEEWRIDVYAVPAGQSAEVKARLDKKVFDDLRSKLKKINGEIAFRGKHSSR